MARVGRDRGAGLGYALVTEREGETSLGGGRKGV